VDAKRFATGLVLTAICFIAAMPHVLAADEPSPTAKPVVTVIDGGAARGILGRAVKSADGKDMGRVVDIIVDPAGKVRAAIIDFGGFLGVGRRTIAVSWQALGFFGAVKLNGDLRLDLTKDQLKAAPEYKEGKPVVVIGSTGALEPLNFPPAPAPEK
jgi:hypothetical protein